MTRRARKERSRAARAPLFVGLLALGLAAGCGPEGGDSGSRDPETAPAPEAERPAPLARLLQGGQVLFGAFSGSATRERGVAMGRNRELDFAFHSLESGPFDLESLGVFMAGLAEGSAPEPTHPVLLRVPPIRGGVEETKTRVRRALEVGVAAVVFPHVESAEDAAVAVEAMGPDAWPLDPEGSRFALLIVEDRFGVERVDEIAATPGVGVVFPGPGDLRRAYDGDVAAVEDAIQRVLAACKSHGVPCGITASADDVADRIAQGFRMFIVSDPAAASAGRRAAGRS